MRGRDTRRVTDSVRNDLRRGNSADFIRSRNVAPPGLGVRAKFKSGYYPRSQQIRVPAPNGAGPDRQNNIDL